MTSLSPGAVQLPRQHLSVRVPWHDTDWTGRVCHAPGENHACSILKNIKQKKIYELEEEVRDRPWAEIDEDLVPPCVLERAGFMRPKAFSYGRTHNYARKNSKSHWHFDETIQRMPAYSTEATPFRWVSLDEDGARRYARTWGIQIDDELERHAVEVMDFQSNWIQDHRNQLALLDSFFSALEPRSSLMLFYAKDVPLVEEPAAGVRYLVGAGLVTSVSPSVEWSYSADGPIRSIMWERCVAHSIRPGFDDGFLLPYQQLMSDPELQGRDLEPFVAIAPRDHFDEFSYVSELVTDDAAIAALVELARVVDLLPGVADGPWEKVSAWIGDRLAETWRARGPYPGLGPMLAAAGLERGPVLAHRILDAIGPDPDPWPGIDRAIREAAGGGPAAGLVGRTARKAWEKLVSDPERHQQLRIMSRFALTVDQARRLFDREALDPREVIDNPYLLYEIDRGPLDGLSLETVDRGLFPQDAASRAALAADPLPEPVEEAGDGRRVRAASVDVLERAAGEGHTVLDEPGLRRRLGALRLDPPCDPPTDVFDLAVEEFEGALVERQVAGGRSRAWQLGRLASTTDLISSRVLNRIEGGPLIAEWEWRDAIDDAIDEELPQGGRRRELEEQARDEKAIALKIIATSRISALIGPAGTGKTTMLQALCAQDEVKAKGILLLAPTGKARVQLADKVEGVRAQTLAQFLRPDRWDWEFGYGLNPQAPVSSALRTVIIDEASMLTEEMLAAAMEAVAEVDRIVLCGDPRQLPPIGAGRPFADLVALLRETSGGGGLAELHVGRRQLPLDDTDRVRDDVAIASMFSIDAVMEGADEALTQVMGGGGDKTFELLSWQDEPDLHRKLVKHLGAAPELQLGPRDANALLRSLGAKGDFNGRPRFDFGSAGDGAELWQLLSPVRARPGGVTGLNQMVRSTWRRGDIRAARRSRKLPSPLGADEVLFNDKVMCIDNHRREAWHVEERQRLKGEVANGEVGIAVFSAGTPPKGLKIEFSSQPKLQFTFWESQLNSDSEDGEVLEVAYAVTIHKAQGSQFGITFVVIPDPCPLLTPELLYTALTRHRERVVVFKQGDLSTIRGFSSPSRSETARRLTCLFRDVDPFTAPDQTVLDGSHVHRTARNEPVRSKSEVIVANTLNALGVEYVYEEDLRMGDGTVRSPDFTIRVPGRPTIYWEHLGMLDRPGYRADWEAKKDWYIRHDVLPWLDGGGPDGTLVWSTEQQGMDTPAIERLASDVLGLG